MKKIIKEKLFSTMLTALLLICLGMLMVVTVSGEELTPTASGSCGDNATWEYYESTGELKISGNGDMKDYYASGVAWDYRFNIKKITVAEGITSIGTAAFRNYYSLTSVELPSSLTGIGERSFFGCSVLTGIEIPSSVTSIGYNAFFKCSSLSEIEIPSGVTSIEAGSFCDCDSLTSIKIPSGVTIIDVDAFNDCDLLTEIEIPSNVMSICDTAFYGCDSLEKVTFAENSRLESIGTYAFSECPSLESIVIPASVTSIGDSAFESCAALTSMTFLSDEPTTLGIYVFFNSPIEAIYVPKTAVDTYKARADWGKYTALISNIPVTASGRCGENAKWEYYESTGELKISGSGSFSFYSSGSAPWYPYSSGIKTVTVSEGISSIRYAFYGCSALISADLPSSLTSIDSCAFQDCSSLKSIKIPSSVTLIGSSAFSGCSSLTSVEIPSGVTSIEDSAFYGCSSLKSIEIPSGVTRIGNHAFCKCSSLTSIEMPSSITGIGVYSFYECSSLKSIKIPSGVTSIAASAFGYCSSLESVEIPTSVTSIGGNAFDHCSSLTSITLLSSNPATLENSAFFCAGIEAIYVPNAAVDTYKTHESWEQYKDIIFPIESDIKYGDANGDGEVGAADVLLLRKYMANYDYETGDSVLIVSQGSDANGDGSVNALDVLLMRKYMANYDYNTGSSSVVLGPKDEAVEHTHTEVIDAAVSATCTETGLTEGKHCSVCNEVIVAQQTVAAGHIYGDDLICDLCGDDKLHFNGGTGADSSPYLISTAKHLDNIRLYPTAHYELINDIEFTSQDYIYSGDFYNSGSYWEPIDDFSGSIDGNGYEISGLKMTRSYSGETVNGITYTYEDFGLFSSTSGKISDLTLSDVNMQIYVSQGDSHSTSVNVGALAGHSSGEITNCEAYGTITVTGNTDLAHATVGGIVGKSSGKIYSSCNYATIKADCTKATYSYGSGTYSSHSSASVGGIVGYFIGTDVFNCKNYGSVYANSIREPHAGGIVAESSSFNINSLIIGCYNYGAVEAVSTPPAKIDSSYNSYGYLTACAGGIAARVSYDETGIFNCGNFADVTAKGWSAHSGGVVSAVYNKSQITQCFNQGGVLASDTDTSSAFIYGNQYAGGISAGGGLIDKCYNSGDVTATGKDYVKSGGIAVYTFAKTSNSYNAGNISAQEGAYSYVGGIIAECPASIEYCYNIGELSGTNKGGIACTVYNGSSGTDIERHILSCYYIDNVTSGVYETLDSCTTQTYKKSDSEMKTQSTFVNFDFYNVWTISDGEYAYPQLKNNYHRTEEPIN